MAFAFQISTSATRAVDIRQCYDIEFYGEQDYAALIESRIKKHWNLHEVLGFFHTAGGVEANTFLGYAKLGLLSVPLTVEGLLDGGVFNEHLLKQQLRIKNAQHIATLMEARDKVHGDIYRLCSPAILVCRIVHHCRPCLCFPSSSATPPSEKCARPSRITQRPQKPRQL